MRKKPEIGPSDYKRELYLEDKKETILVEIWKPRPVEITPEPLIKNQKNEKFVISSTLFAITSGDKILHWQDVSGNDEIQSIILALEAINIQLTYNYPDAKIKYKNMNGWHGFPFIDPREPGTFQD